MKKNNFQWLVLLLGFGVSVFCWGSSPATLQACAAGTGMATLLLPADADAQDGNHQDAGAEPSSAGQVQDQEQDSAEEKGESDQPNQAERSRRGQSRERVRRPRDPSRELSKRSSEVESLFRPLVASAEASTVQVLSSDRLVAL